MLFGNVHASVGSMNLLSIIRETESRLRLRFFSMHSLLNYFPALWSFFLAVVYLNLALSLMK